MGPIPGLEDTLEMSKFLQLILGKIDFIKYLRSFSFYLMIIVTFLSNFYIVGLKSNCIEEDENKWYTNLLWNKV